MGHNDSSGCNVADGIRRSDAGAVLGHEAALELAELFTDRSFLRQDDTGQRLTRRTVLGHGAPLELVERSQTGPSFVRMTQGNG